MELENLVAAQQDQIELLSTTLAQIESLPTIRRLLEDAAGVPNRSEDPASSSND